MRKLLFFCFVMFIITSFAFAQDTKIDQEFTMEMGKELVLGLNSFGGDIKIEGWDDTTVRIEGEIRARGWNDDCRFEVRERSSGISLIPDCGYSRRHDGDRGRVKLTIKVPKKFDISVKAAADLIINNVEGVFDISIGNADAELTACKGQARINTANGRLTIEDSDLEGDISNVNGKLRIRNSNIGGEVGTVNSTMEVSRADDGIEVSSVNGRIEIPSVKRFVQAKTTNGSVQIGELDGWIEAETVNGSVTVSMIGNTKEGKHDVDIETLNGDVEIFLPDDFSMDVDIRARIEGDRNRRGVRILSDFNITIDEEEDRWGDKYEVRGSGTVGNGKHKVRIRAVNGDVYLKKM